MIVNLGQGTGGGSYLGRNHFVSGSWHASTHFASVLPDPNPLVVIRVLNPECLCNTSFANAMAANYAEPHWDEPDAYVGSLRHHT